MHHPDSHTTKQHTPPNQFVSAWKKLNSSQKGSVIALSVLALILPITVLASRYQKNINSRAALQTQNVITPPGKNLAIKFPNENGNNSYLVVTAPDSASFDLATGNPFTIEAWVKIPKPVSGNYLRNYTLMMLTKPQTTTDYGYIYKLSLETQEATGTTRSMFSALKNTFDSNINSNYISVISNSEIKNSIPPNTWTHIAITSFSENQQCFLNLYLNGTFVDGAGNSAPNCQISTQQPLQLVIAKYPDSSGGIDAYYYPGAIDELRISNNIRYAQNFIPTNIPFTSDDNTIALWHFDGNTIDASNRGHTFTVNGPAAYVEVNYPLLTPTPALTIYPTNITPPISVIPSPSLSPTPTITLPPPTFVPPTFTPTPPPLLVNGSFEIDKDKNLLPDSWQAKRLKSADKLDSQFVFNGKYSFKFNPATSDTQAQLIQFVGYAGRVNDAISINIWNRSSGTVTLGKAGIVMSLTYTDGGKDTASGVFPLDTHNWKNKKLVLIADRPYRSVKITIFNNNRSATYWVDAANFTITPDAKTKGITSTLNELSIAELKLVDQ